MKDKKKLHDKSQDRREVRKMKKSEVEETRLFLNFSKRDKILR
jgi:hypothetical protein